MQFDKQPAASVEESEVARFLYFTGHRSQC